MVRQTGIATINPLEEEFSLLSSVAVLRGKEGLLENRFWRFLNSPRGKKYMLGMVSGVAITRLTLTKINDAEIPLPPLEVQKEIVAEIEGYQKVIDGARAVLDNYRPHIPIHPDWPMVELERSYKRSRDSPRPEGDQSYFRVQCSARWWQTSARRNVCDTRIDPSTRNMQQSVGCEKGRC